ncbi:MAG TPA: hypothetical protein GX705_03830 [Clostridiales bacterium]|nr:hypothetical protein [Clostridiales bacterium]
MNNRLNIKVIVFMALCVFSLLSYKDVSAMEEKTLKDGVYIDSVHIGGMTIEEAKEAVNNYIEELENKTITIKIEEDTEEVSLADLGLKTEDFDFIEETIQIGEIGNVVRRYKEIKDVAHNNLVYTLEFNIDKKAVREYVETKLSSYDVPSKNASLKREDGEFVYTDHEIGRIIEVNDTVKLIEDAVANEWNKEDIKLLAVISPDEPEITRDMVEKVDSKLGSFTTNYSKSSSSRAANQVNGAKLINNTVLYPGEEFNAYDKLTPFSVSNGYEVGGAYVQGKLVDSIGGGACQVTTTLYNAALYAELEITERAAHSMTVSYVDLARDAAIAGTYKNLKFKNDTEYPVLIQGFTKGRNITFTIWGHDTRPDNREVKYETVVLSTRQPPKDVVKKDSTQPVSYEKTTQSAYTGYVAELYKIVTVGGEQVSRERVNKSSYMAAPRYVTVGTMPEPSPTPIPEETVEPVEPGAEQSEKPEPGPKPDTKTDPGSNQD